MVAIVSGNGLGLFDSSLISLGRGFGGSFGVGQNGESSLINIANGNLILQDQDETIFTRGLPLSFVRTYNSRGVVMDGSRQVQVGQDGWLNVFERRVSGLTGKVDTLGSTIKRTLADGSEVVFTYDASRSAYVSTAGDGAHDTLTWHAGTSRWTWTEGSSRQQEVYDASGTNGGRLSQILDGKSGAQYDLSYDASGRLTSVASSLTNGDGLYFVYDASNRLAAINTREGGISRGQVWYEYDTVGRLSAVITDLTPDVVADANALSAQRGDNAWNSEAIINNGQLYRTTYEYMSDSASDLRIRTVRQSDGALVSFDYDASGRVSRSTVGDTNGNDGDGVGQTTLYSYGGDVGGLTSTTVTDSLGRSWVYKFDTLNKQLREVHSPAVNGVVDVTSYQYDASGNVTEIKTVRGGATLSQMNYEYDAAGRGNVVKQWDLLGNRIDRTYDLSNEQLLSETRYTAVDPDRMGSANPVGGQVLTTRYVYDAATSRLRFSINAANEVTEYLYGTSGGAAGQVTTMRRFTGATYAGALWSERDVTAWASNQSLAASERTDYVYDAMGRSLEKQVFASVTSAGVGILDSATQIVRYSYDAQGLLRQQITQRGSDRALNASTPRAGSEVVDYSYDGMGRLLSVTSSIYGVAASDTTTIQTTYVYTDSGSRIAVTSDAGATRTELRNAAGQVISVSVANAPSSPTVIRTTQMFYDAAGQLRGSEDASGARRYFFYDAKGRLEAEVDATGAVTRYEYDGADRRLRSVSYANRVSTATWLSGTTVTKASFADIGVVADAANDRTSVSTYDAAGRLLTQTDAVSGANRQITTYTYDGAGRIVLVRVTDGVGTLATARVTRNFYDAAGRLEASLDAERYLVRYTYDRAGRVVQTTRYANVIAAPATIDAGTLLSALVITSNAINDQTTRYFYNGRGQQIGSVDALGYLTETLVDEAGNTRAERRYAKQLTGLTGTETFAGLKAAAMLSAPVEAYRETKMAYNGLGQLITQTNAEGTVTRFSYDEAGRLVRTQTAENTSDVRESYRRYNVFDEVIGEMSGEQALLAMASLGGKLLDDVTLTQAQLNAVYAQFGVTHQYDSLSRRTESVDAQGNKTFYFYDAQGRQTFVVKGVESNGVRNAAGEVTETRYNAFGQVQDSLVYTGRIVLGVPGSRASVESAIGTLSFVAATDTRRQFIYDQRGLLRQRFDGVNTRSDFSYNAFGQLQTEINAVGSAAQVTTSYDYDKRGLLTARTEGMGTALVRSSSQTYDAFGRVITRLDGRNGLSTMSYDRLGRELTRSVSVISEGVSRWETLTSSYDAFDRLLTMRDALGNVTTYVHSDSNRSVTVTTPEGVQITTARNRHGQTLTVTQVLPGGATVVGRTTYDKNGAVLTSTNALNQSSGNLYDARGLLTESTDASGRKVAYTYDAIGRVLTRVEDPAGMALTTRYAYDAQGRQISVTDASGRVSTMSYDAEGRLLSMVQDPAGLNVRTEYRYDALGRQVTVTEGAGTATARTVEYVYDVLGRRTQERVDPNGLNLTTKYFYDANNNVVQRTDATGRSTRFVYDQANRLVYQIESGGSISKTTYDAAGRVTMTHTYLKVANVSGLSMQPSEADMRALVIDQALTNESLDLVNYRIYDRDGRVVMTINGTGSVVSLTYDVAGRLIVERQYTQALTLTVEMRNALKAGTAKPSDFAAFTSANMGTAQSRRTVYDAAGRAVFNIDASGSYTRNWYDAAGRQVAQVRFAIRLNPALLSDATTVAQLDTQLTWPNENQTSYTVYDAAGRVSYTVQMIAPDKGTVKDIRYDGAGRVLQERSFVATFAYDSAMALKLVQGRATDADFTSFVSANASTALSQRTVYDAAGRAVFSIDASGAYTRNWYDASGRQVAQVRFAIRLNPALLSDATTVAQLDTQLTWPSENRTSYTVYDAAGRVSYTVQMIAPDKGTVKDIRYDGAGRVLQERSFVATFAYDSAMALKLVQGRATDADFTSFVSANASTAQSLRSVYDAAGQAIYTIDALGAVTRNWYDAAGRVVTTRRFATPLNPSAINDATTVAQLDNWQSWVTSDQTEQRVYDAAGRLRLTYDWLGQVTQYDYDGAGRLVNTQRYAVAHWVDATVQGKLFAGTATMADFAAFTSANAGTARSQTVVYDAAGLARYTVTRSGAGLGIVSERQYDGIGRVVAELRYDVSIAFSPNQTAEQVAAAVQAGLSSDPAIRATQTRRTQYVYDAVGQQRFVLDATGALSEQRYDAAGRVVETRTYGNRPTGVSLDVSSLSAWGQGQPAALVRKVTTTYDTAGNVLARTDALNQSERFTYDGLGQMLTRTDRTGAVWTYQYDAAGRRTVEISPITDVYGIDAAGNLSLSVRSLVTRYSYDGVGNLLTKTENADTTSSRVTQYEYDNRGNRIKTILPHPGAIDRNTGALVFTGPAPTIEVTYNALGQAVVQKDARNNYSYKIYDEVGRLASEVDQELNVTIYTYNTFGEQIRLIRYAAVLNKNASAFTSVNWQAGQAISWSQIVAGVDNGNWNNRGVLTGYDLLGRKTEVVQSQVSYYAANGSVSNGNPTTRFAYNAYGEVVKESVLLSGTADQAGALWADTWRYYDAAGRNVVTVDAEGYVTATTYNATGDATRTVEYARAIATAGLSTQTPPALPTVGDVVIGYDRETLWSFDVLGRKASETVVRRYHDSNGIAGERAVSTSYGYDNEDRVTTMTNDAGTTETLYNRLGQVMSVREPTRAMLASTVDAALRGSAANGLGSAGLYVQRSPYTTLAYDAFGRVIASRRHANGHDGVTAVISANDQINLTFYDTLDRALMSQDAMGNKTYSAYDEAGHVIHSWSRLEGSDDSRDAMVDRFYTYDKTGRQLSSQQRRQTLGGVSLGVDQSEVVRYNAFGEITEKTYEGLTGQLQYGYDTAGRMLWNNENGAIRNFGYNLAGHQVRQWHKVKPSASEAAIDVSTWTQTDRLGRAVTITQPSYTTNVNQTVQLTQRFDRWGNVVQVIDARNNQTNYQYNDSNQVIRETRALAWVVGENGAGSWQRPENQWYYDANGRLVGTRDANGNTRKIAYDAVGRQISSTNGTKDTTLQAYDIFGNQRLSQDALGYITFKDYNLNNQITSIGDYLPQGSGRTRNVLQSYVLNQAGDRIQVTNALNATSFYDYDSQQRLLRSQSAMGVVMKYGYDVQGHKVSEINGLAGAATFTDREGESVQLHAQSWNYDVFGRLIDHNNLSGRDSDYVYDPESGMLMQESSAGGVGLGANNVAEGKKNISYYPNGQIREIKEEGGGTYRYEYDAAGNRILEEVKTTDGAGKVIHLVTRTTYDSHNRVSRVTQDDQLITKRVFDLTYDYDAVGNRRRVVAQSAYGANVTGIAVEGAGPPPAGTLAAQVDTDWYTYDAENRVLISGGVLSGAAGAAGTSIVLAMQATNVNSWSVVYDAAGRVVNTYYKRYVGSVVRDTVHTTQYDLRGNRQFDFHMQILGVADGGGGIAKQYVYDSANQLIETRAYYEQGRMMDTNRSIEGELQQRDVSGWLSSASQIRYDADGRQLWQMGRERAEAPLDYIMSADKVARQFTDLTVLDISSRTDYTLSDGSQAWLDTNPDNNASAYDSAGRMLSYRYSDKAPDGSWYTHTFTSTYEGWQGYQEQSVAGVSTNSLYKPTTNTLTYDAFGRVIKQQEHTEYQNGAIDDRMRVYSYNGDGQVQNRREGTNKKTNGVYAFAEGEANVLGAKPNYGFVYSGGQQVASLMDGGKTKFGVVTGSIVSVNGNGAYGAGGGMVTAMAGENLRSLAQRVYGNQSLWYVLADANGMSDPEKALTAGMQLQSPGVSVTSNDANSFKPYNASEAIGPTSPSLPYIAPPPSSGCGAVGMIIMAVVAVVVMVYAPYLAEAIAPAVGAVLGAGVSAGVVSGVATGIAAGVVATGTHAVATGIASAAGLASFSWRSSIATGITSGITAGIGGFSPASIAGQAAKTLVNASAGYIGNKIAGVQGTSFSWRSIAASAVANAVTARVAPLLTKGMSEFASDFTGGIVGGVVNHAARKAFGFDEKFNFASVAAQSFVDAAGNHIGRGINARIAGRAELAMVERLEVEAAEPISFDADGLFKLNPPVIDDLLISNGSVIDLSENGGLSAGSQALSLLARKAESSSKNRLVARQNNEAGSIDAEKFFANLDRIEAEIEAEVARNSANNYERIRDLHPMPFMEEARLQDLKDAAAKYTALHNYKRNEPIHFGTNEAESGTGQGGFDTAHKFDDIEAKSYLIDLKLSDVIDKKYLGHQLLVNERIEIGRGIYFVPGEWAADAKLVVGGELNKDGPAFVAKAEGDVTGTAGSILFEKRFFADSGYLALGAYGAFELGGAKTPGKTETSRLLSASPLAIQGNWKKALSFKYVDVNIDLTPQIDILGVGGSQSSSNAAGSAEWKRHSGKIGAGAGTGAHLRYDFEYNVNQEAVMQDAKTYVYEPAKQLIAKFTPAWAQRFIPAPLKPASSTVPVNSNSPAVKPSQYWKPTYTPAIPNKPWSMVKGW